MPIFDCASYSANQVEHAIRAIKWEIDKTEVDPVRILLHSI